MSDTRPVTTARHPRVMDPVIAYSWGERGTIVSLGDRIVIACDDHQINVPLDRLRWTGTAWVIIPEHAA